MEESKFNFTVPTKVTPQQICNLLCTAFDGNMTSCWAGWKTIMPDESDWSWCTPEDRKTWDDVRKCYVAAMCGGMVVIVDHEEDDKEYILDRAALHRGVKAMSEKFPEHWADFINENDDAITGDIFVQCCVFGDTVYG
jgi:hypothetical protein